MTVQPEVLQHVSAFLRGIEMDDRILKDLSQTYLYERIKKIRGIYKKLEKRQEKFCTAFDIHCKAGCDGSCCTHFIPDVSETEAEFLAYGLIKEGKDDLVLELMRAKEENTPYCPLYIADSPYHCSIYKWRPLVCRLFGAAAVTDKNGEPVYRKCRWNPSGEEVPTEVFEAHRGLLVLMHDYEMMISEIGSPDTDTELITAALPKAVDKIRYMLELEKEEKSTI